MDEVIRVEGLRKRFGALEVQSDSSHTPVARSTITAKQVSALLITAEKVR